MAKKFDIVVFDEDKNVSPQKQSGVMASSREALIGMFRMCGQNIQILREYSDEESANYGKGPSKENIDKMMNSNDPLLMKMPELPKPQAGAQPTPSQPTPTPQEPPKAEPPRVPTPQPDLPHGPAPHHPEKAPTPQPAKNEPPRYFELGGVKCKIEGGKVYEKKWVRLSDEEASEYRIVNVSTGKPVALKDKAIEVLKWAPADTTDKGVVNSAEEKDEEKKVLICG